MTNAMMGRTEAVKVYKNEALADHCNRLQKINEPLNPYTEGKALRYNTLHEEQHREDSRHGNPRP